MAKGLFGYKDKNSIAPVTISTEQRENGRTWITGHITIKAPLDIVWYSVHEERKHDPDLAYSKILNQSENQSTLEQKFTLIPVIGTAVCTIHTTEVPLHRIDYRLIKSDHFKALEGSWVLTPSEDKNVTSLELSSHLDLGLPIPKMLMNSVAAKKLEHRLTNVRKMAEEINMHNQQKLVSHPERELANSAN